MAIVVALKPDRTVTTSSAEAYNIYKEAVDFHDQFYIRKAMEGYEKAVAIDSQFAIAQARLANAYTAMGYAKKADEMRKRAYENRVHVSEREQLWLDLFKAQWDGDAEKANALAEEFYKRYPDDLEAISASAYRCFALADFERSVEQFQELIRKFPNHAPAYNMLGYLNYYLGRYDDALAMLDKYIELSPDQANPHDSRGEILHALGRYEEAISEFRQAFNINPDFDYPVLHMAQSYQVLGQNRQADYCFEILAAQQPNEVKQFQYANARASLLASREDFVGAKELLKEVWAIAPADYKQKDLSIDGVVNLAWVLYRERNKDSLLMLWDLARLVAAELGKDNAKFFESDGYKNVKLVVDATSADVTGNLNEAEQRFSELIAAADFPDARTAYRIYYADLLARQGKYDQAISELQKNISINPNGPKTLAKLGDIYEASGNVASAQSYRQRAQDVWKNADPEFRPLLNLRKKMQAPLAATARLAPANAN